MNGKDIFLGLKYIGDDLVEQAEYSQFPAKVEIVKRKRHGIRRPLLIAAIVAMMLLLVGCAVVYMLSLKEIKLGEQTVTYDVYHEDPNIGDPFMPVGQEKKNQQVLTLAGMGETPASQAAREWYAFLETYDADGQIRKAVWGKEPDFGEEYYGYGLYTQEMKDKLDEILEKYELKLRGKQVKFQTSKLLFHALGMENVMNSDSEARMRMNHTAYYENGNLDVYFEITIPDEAGADTETTNGYLFYRPKDCFIPDTAILAEAEWEEWNYTTASGNAVLMVYSDETASAWIFSDMETCTASLRVDVVKRMAVEKSSGKQTAKFERLSKAQLEQVADAIDFTLEPKLVDGWETLSDGAVPAGQEINGYRIDVDSAFTDGYGFQIILRISAPEDVALTDPVDHTGQIRAGNNIYGSCREDGDGKRNTCHYILSEYTSEYDYPEDGSLPYPEGYVIPIYWEDLYYSYFDSKKIESVETFLTEGTWKFDVPLNDADTREIELLTEPITAKGCVGWKIDGTDVFEDTKITSIKLRSLGLELTSENENADFLCFTGQFACIAMKDGSTLEVINREFDEAIDLDQVAYVQLADNTIIPMPGVDEKTVQMISQALYCEPEGDEIPVYEDGVELISEPVILKNLAGFATDATGDMDPLYEYFTLSSFVLHPYGAVAQDKRALETPDTEIHVFLKDGSMILLTNSGCGRTVDGVAFSTFQSQIRIELKEVDYLLLPDGTKLTMP